MLRTALPIFLALCVSPVVAQAQQNFDVYILAGQSNADGRGLASDITGSSLLSNPSGAIINYLNPSDPSEGGGDGDVTSGGFQNLGVGFSVAPGEGRIGDVPNATDYFGLELSFANAIGGATGSTNDIAIIKVTRGGTNLRNDWFAPTANDSTSGFLYDALISHVDESLAALRADGSTANVEGFLWHQGESDSGSSNNISNYPGLFTDLVEGVRGNFGDDIPVVLGELAQSRPGNTAEFNSTLQTFVDTTNLSGVSLVSSVGLTTPGDTLPRDPLPGEDIDFTHFDAASQIELGERFASTLAATTVDDAPINGPDPVQFAITNGENVDENGVGGTLTATSDGGVDLTLTVTDITSYENDTEGSALVSLSDDPDAGHLANINGGNSLGINGEGTGGHDSEAANFSPGEALTFVFDEDIEFVSIDLQSFVSDFENNGFRLSSSAFDDVEIEPDDLLDGDDGNDFIFEEGLFVAAGTEITFEAFSTTGTFNAADSFRIQDFSVNIIPSTVPEPSSLAILGLLGSLATIRRRRR